MSEWTATSDSMPGSGRRVLFAWTNALGNTRVGAGSWTAANTEEAEGDWLEDERCVYDEELDLYWKPEGWTEWGWELEFSADPDGAVTHWAPMLLHPSQRATT